MGCPWRAIAVGRSPRRPGWAGRTRCWTAPKLTWFNRSTPTHHAPFIPKSLEISAGSQDQRPTEPQRPRPGALHANLASSPSEARYRQLASMPNGRTVAPGRSTSPHQAHRPGRVDARRRFSHSATQHAKARASACGRDSFPSNSAMAARSSKNACQSSAVHSAPPGRSSAIMSALCRASSSSKADGGGASASKTRCSPSSATMTPASLCCPQDFSRAHSRALQP